MLSLRPLESGALQVWLKNAGYATGYFAARRAASQRLLFPIRIAPQIFVAIYPLLDCGDRARIPLHFVASLSRGVEHEARAGFEIISFALQAQEAAQVAQKFFRSFDQRLVSQIEHRVIPNPFTYLRVGRAHRQVILDYGPQAPVVTIMLEHGADVVVRVPDHVDELYLGVDDIRQPAKDSGSRG